MKKKNRGGLEDDVAVPCDGFVVGEPVSVIAFDYDGDKRRGLTAGRRRVDGREHVVAGSKSKTGDRQPVSNCGKRVSVPGFAAISSPVAGLDLSGPIELAALSVKQKAARCRLLGSDRIVTLRASRLWDVYPGEIVMLNPRKQWNYDGHPYLSGTIESTRLDVAALGLVPLKIEDCGLWDPHEHYWGEEDEPIEEWAKPIIVRGPRREFEMEQVLPGQDPEDPFSDPISESNESKDSGDIEGAYKILIDLCQADLRCLDAHSHLGNFVFHGRPKEAIRHYEAGLRIGELSLGEGFDGLLPWGWIDNRPFLRCMHGFGLCLWRLGRFEEAERIFDRMLWLNPSDNQGVRFLTGEVRARAAWENSREK